VVVVFGVQIHGHRFKVKGGGYPKNPGGGVGEIHFYFSFVNNFPRNRNPGAGFKGDHVFVVQF
jgi:hypothetical protein